MSDKKPGITMANIASVKPETVAPKARKPGITTNKVNAPAPAPRAVGPIVRGPMITTHDEPKAGTFDAQKAIDNLVIDISKDVPIPFHAPELGKPVPEDHPEPAPIPLIPLKKRGGRPKKA